MPSKAIIVKFLKIFVLCLLAMVSMSAIAHPAKIPKLGMFHSHAWNISNMLYFFDFTFS